MRKFNTVEQDLIREIVSAAQNNDSYLIFNILYPILQGNGNSVGIDFDSCELLFYKIANSPVIWDTSEGKQTLSISSFLGLEAQLIERALLIKQLEDNNLIYFLNDGNSSNINHLFFKEIELFINKTFDKELMDIIRKSLESPIVCMPELINMVENDFISEEDRRHQEKIETLKEQMNLSEQQHKQRIMQNEIHHKDDLSKKDDEIEASKIDAKYSRRLAVIIAIASSIVSVVASSLITKHNTLKYDQIEDYVTRITDPIEKADSLVFKTLEVVETRSKNDSILLIVKDAIPEMQAEISRINKGLDNLKRINLTGLYSNQKEN